MQEYCSFPTPREYPKSRTPNSGFYGSYGVDERALRWIYFLDPPIGSGSAFWHHWQNFFVPFDARDDFREAATERILSKPTGEAEIWLPYLFLMQQFELFILAGWTT